MALTWGEGRRLKKVNLSWGTVDFAYDSDGKRVKKTSGNTETKYYYNGSTLIGLVKTTTGSTGTTKTTVQFVYDAEGKPFLLRFNGKTDYFYLYNGLGDITGLVDSSNKVVVRYQYNSWGKVTSTQDTSGVSLATLNPFRYRKYVYDPETGLYCLGSRYYDPEVGRFVNADDFETLTYQMDSVQGKNLYQYCFNNPINMQDEDGGWPKWVTQVLVGTAVIAAAAALTVATAGTGTALAAVAVGALKGSVIGAIGGAAVGATSGAIASRISTGSWKNSGTAALKWGAVGFTTGAIVGAAIGAGAGLIKNKNFEIQAVGRLKSKGATGKGHLGVKYSYNRVTNNGTKVQTVVNSIEIHAPHGDGAKHNFWHWQLNRWPNGKARAVHHWKIYFRRID